MGNADFCSSDQEPKKRVKTTLLLFCNSIYKFWLSLSICTMIRLHPWAKQKCQSDLSVLNKRESLSMDVGVLQSVGIKHQCWHFMFSCGWKLPGESQQEQIAGRADLTSRCSQRFGLFPLELGPVRDPSYTPHRTVITSTSKLLLHT